MSDLMEFWSDVDTDSVAPSTGIGDPIPPEDYMLQMVEQEVKPTNDGTGIVLSCQFQVVQGQYENRIVFVNFNIRNKSAQSQQIGIAEFKALCAATNIPFEAARVDTTQLLYVPFKAKVGIGRKTEKYPDPRNDIKKYYPQGGAVTMPTQATKPTAPKTTGAGTKPAAGGGLPWKK